MSIPTAPLFTDSNGRISCVRHSGQYVEAECEQRPDSMVIATPRDLYLRVTPGDLAEWETDRVATPEIGPIACEECGARPDFTLPSWPMPPALTTTQGEP